MKAINDDRKLADETFEKDKIIGGIKGCIDKDCEEKQQIFINKHKETIDGLKTEIYQLNSDFTDQKSKNQQFIKEMEPYIDII